MLDFAHDNRLFSRCAAQNAVPVGDRLVLNKSDLSTDAARTAWVTAIKSQVASGEYLTEAKLDRALDVMLDETTH